jgi:hypothetical protein
MSRSGVLWSDVLPTRPLSPIDVSSPDALAVRTVTTLQNTSARADLVAVDRFGNPARDVNASLPVLLVTTPAGDTLELAPGQFVDMPNVGVFAADEVDNATATVALYLLFLMDGQYSVQFLINNEPVPYGNVSVVVLQRACPACALLVIHCRVADSVSARSGECVAVGRPAVHHGEFHAAAWCELVSVWHLV